MIKIQHVYCMNNLSGSLLKLASVNNTSSQHFAFVCGIKRYNFLSDSHHSISWCYSKQSFSTSGLLYFFQRDRKDNYGSGKKIRKIEAVREGFKMLRPEFEKFQQEVKEHFAYDPILVRPGDFDKKWIFNSKKSFEDWVVTADKDNNEGYSSCTFTLSPAGYGLFSGELCTEVPKDGTQKRAGYCNIRSIKPYKSFKRPTCLDWSLYTHFVMRVRGDGRSYMINLGASGYFDVTWLDMYSYVLYTRGGPYWQETKIPFSKFFLNSKGRVQDKQCAIAQDRVLDVGITAADKIDGRFNLEIDYIGLYCDPIHKETFAYEMYRVPKFITGV